MFVSVGVTLMAGHFADKRVRVASSPPLVFEEAGATNAPAEIPPWGELLKRELEIERPEEYIAARANARQIAPWVFERATPDEVRRTMSNCGLTAEQIARAFAPRSLSVAGSNTVIHPDGDLVFSLSRDVRTRLYNELDQYSANEYIRFPFFLREKAFEESLNDCQFDPETAAMVRSLTYRRGDYICLSDLEAALQRIPSDEQRLKLVKVLSRQTVVLARLRIRPTTDIDKVLRYWTSAPGVRMTNLRPLLESFQRLPDGGVVSLVYLLPPFARERLYTYPLSSYTESWMDCGWSALNFFNETNDNRFADPHYFRSYLSSNYYRVDKANRYGDLILVLDQNDKVVHSAVYVADDLVFTKNGANYMQPWTLMRIKDMLMFFEGMNARNVLILRNNRT